jgi:3-hydroxyacyl-[acyl-carrier-protein] dehydratase
MRTLNIPADHPAFAGHFPGSPILPGVVLLQEVLQEAMQVAARQAPEGEAPGTWVIEQAKFLHPVAPGDGLQLHLSPTAGRFDFEVRLGEALVLKGRLAYTHSGATA